MGYVIGVDTGGTFTDSVVIQDDGRSVNGKAPTTPTDLVEGILGALTRASEALGLTLEDLLRQTTLFRYSGTTAVNALLSRSGAVTGLLTTRGFEDTLHIARAMSGWAGLQEEEVRRIYALTKPEQIIPKRNIRGISERVDYSGQEVVALDTQEVVKATEELVNSGADSLAVCFTWSIRNNEHEARVGELVRENFPQLYVSLSHEIAPVVGEYGRFMTTAIDAYVGPRLRTTLQYVKDRLEARGMSCELVVSQSNGESLRFDETRPVYTLQSGPAAGVIATKTEGELLGFSNVIAADVGGTSFDVGLVADGAWLNAREPVVDSFHVSFPMIEVESIGAGGGSIAWTDEAGALQVGPRSAGAAPGPACYGQGNEEPTVTDAAVVLGYLNPESFLGGRMTLDTALAEGAVATLGECLGLEPLKTAAGIFEVANAHMTTQLRRRVLARGHDPRDFILLTYGGAGPLHAGFCAQELGAREAAVPSVAGTFSALGAATSPLHHSARSDDLVPMPMDANYANRQFATLRAQVVARLDRDGVPEERQRLTYSLDILYGLQVNPVNLPLEPKAFGQREMDEAAEEFDDLYERLFGRGSGFPEAGRYVTAFVAEGFGEAPVPDRSIPSSGAGYSSGRRSGHRRAYFDGEMVDVDVYRYEDQQAGAKIAGPAVIDGTTTTIVVPSGQQASFDKYLYVHLTHG